MRLPTPGWILRQTQSRKMPPGPPTADRIPQQPVSPESQAPANRHGRLAALAVPPLMAVILLYRVLADLQVTVLRPETLLIAAGWLGGACLLGVVAAFGGRTARILVLGLVVLVWTDVTFRVSTAFEVLTPASRAVAARDRTRVADIRAIQAALERHIAEIGPLPKPADYGEGTGPAAFWEGWWDSSAHDDNGDGRPFLEFLIDRGVMSEVPVDPSNEAPAGGHPSRGQQYVYYVVPPGYAYEGGQCNSSAASTYLLGVTDLESENQRPPTGVSGSGCDCLWRNQPNFFQQHFDFIVCGQFVP